MYVLVCHHQGTEGKEEQSVGSHAAQQFPPPGRSALLHHHQPQPTGPGQEEDLPSMVRNKLQTSLTFTFNGWNETPADDERRSDPRTRYKKVRLVHGTGQIMLMFVSWGV